MNNTFNILMADDDIEDIQLTKEILGDIESTINFQSVRDGESLINLLNTQKDSSKKTTLPHLILLDLNMPVMDGREALKEIKNNDSLRKIPVAIFTTSQSRNDIEKAYTLGANCYVIKPSAYVDWENTLKMISQFWMKYAQIPGL